MTDKKIFLVSVENCLDTTSWKNRVELSSELEEKITEEFVEWWDRQEQTSLRQEAKFIFQKLKESLNV